MIVKKKTRQQKAVQYIALAIIIAFTLTIFGAFIIH
jgi:hypothetical protein